MLCLLMLAPGALVGLLVITSLLAPAALIGIPFMVVVFADTANGDRADARRRAFAPSMAPAMAH